MEPLPREQAGIEMSPEEFRELRSKLIVVEEELDEMENRSDLDIKTRKIQRKQFIAIAASVCDDFESAEISVDEIVKGRNDCKQTWRHSGQAYCVKTWSATELETNQEENMVCRKAGMGELCDQRCKDERKKTIEGRPRR